MEQAAELIEAFVHHGTARGWSPLTLRTRGFHVRRFLEWSRGRGVKRPSDVTPEVVEAYRRHLAERITTRGRTACARTQQGEISSVQAFGRFLVATRRLLLDPCRELELPRLPRTLPEVLTRREVCRLLAAPDPRGLRGRRDRALLACLYATGLRVSEASALGLGDVDADERTLTVRGGKGARDRVIPLGRRLLDLIVRYRDEVRPRLLAEAVAGGWTRPAETFFVSTRGSRLAPWAIERLMGRYVRAARLKKRVSPHTLRHTCATHLLEAGAELRVVQELLGHRRLGSTEHYTRMTLAHLKKVHRRNHPREREERG